MKNNQPNKTGVLKGILALELEGSTHWLWDYSAPKILPRALLESG